MTLLTVGAAMPSTKLPDFINWLNESSRDLELQDPVNVEILDGDWQSHAAQIKSILDGYTGRIGVHGPFISLTLAAHDPKIRAVVSGRMLQSLDFCAEIGATHMVVHSPTNFLGTPFLPHTDTMDQEYVLDALHETLKDVLPKAAQIGCTLVMENIFDQDPGFWVTMVKSFNSDHLRCSVDTGHAHINHMRGAPPVDYWLREAGPLLDHVHIQDTDGHSDRHWLPGEGTIRWASVFRELEKIEQKPRLLLELADVDRTIEAAAWLKSQGLAQ